MTLVKRALVTVAAAVLVAAIILVGEKDSELSSDQQFAEDLCAAAIPYADDLLDVYDGVVHARATPGKDGWGWLLFRAESGRFIAREYGLKVRQLDVPDTPAGRQVEKKRLLDFHSRRPAEILSDAVQRIRSVPPRKMTLVQNIRGLNRLQDDLLFAMSAMGPAVFVTPNLVDGLADEFDAAAACKKLDAVFAKEDRT